MVLVNIVFSRLATGICNRSFHRRPTLQTLSAPLLQGPASKRITPPMSTYLPYPCRRRRCTPAIEISHFPVCAASRCRDAAHQSFPPNMYATCKLDTYLRVWSRHRFSNVFCSPSRAPFFLSCCRRNARLFSALRYYLSCNARTHASNLKLRCSGTGPTLSPALVTRHSRRVRRCKHKCRFDSCASMSLLLENPRAGSPE